MKTDTDVLFSRKRTGAMDPTVNISKAIFICNLFHFFFAASKACLIPYLTIFFRLLGMSATETGLIIAFKTITGFVWAPLWARCAISYNKRRFMLMFSLFMFAASYLSLSLVYQHTTQYDMCNDTLNSNNRLILPSFIKPIFGQGDSTTVKPDGMMTEMTTSTVTIQNTTKSVPITSSIVPTLQPLVTEPLTTPKILQPLVTKPLTSPKIHQPLVTEPITHPRITTPGLTTPPAPPLVMTTITTVTNDKLEQVAKDILNELNLSPNDLIRLNTTGPELYKILHQQAPDLKITPEEINQLWDFIQQESENPTDSNKISPHPRQKRSVIYSWDEISQRTGKLWESFAAEKVQMFLAVLLIIIAGEFLSCSIEKVADDSWFDFLDRIDDLEKYGKQRLGGNFAFVIFPLGISLVIYFTDCMLPLDVNHFLLHFFAFGFLLAITFIIAFFYPVPPPQNHEYSSKVLKGLRIVCCDCQGLMYILTMLIMGIVYASYHNFLFWVIQDLGGSELNMGMCVSIGAFAEIPMLLISQKMVKKMGNAGVVSLALFLLSLRVLYYSFLPAPWAVMPAELLHAFTHTAMWFAVLSYEDFNVGAMVDRSIRSILSSIYFGVGFSFGCLISGLVYDIFGYAILFQACSIIIGLWFIIFSIVSKCIPKKERIRYVKLLHAGDTDESDSVEDDWLEMALKEH